MSGDSAMWALGLMSGTSMDGVDAALIRTDGEGIAEFGPTLFQPYGDEERAVLRAALKDAHGMTARDDRFGRLAEAETVVTDAHAHAVAVLLIAAIGHASLVSTGTAGPPELSDQSIRALAELIFDRASSIVPLSSATSPASRPI